MQESTCSIPDCGRPKACRGMCSIHYARVRATGEALRPCKACGRDCIGSYGSKVYCSPSCRPACGVTGCTRKVDGSSDLCQVHRSSVYKYGRLPNSTWAAEKRCFVCGRAHNHPRFRKFCSGRCKQLWHRNGGAAPERFKQCSRCTTIIDLSLVGPAGRRRRSDVQMCDACLRSKYTRHRMSTTELADRDGTQCGICGDTVDMTLLYPDLFRPSVDHVLPFSKGGSHDPANLQLAHLWCNYVKSDKPDFTI